MVKRNIRGVRHDVYTVKNTIVVDEMNKGENFAWVTLSYTRVSTACTLRNFILIETYGLPKFLNSSLLTR